MIIRFSIILCLIIAVNICLAQKEERDTKTVDFEIDLSMTTTTRLTKDSSEYLNYGVSASLVYFPLNKFTLIWGLNYFVSRRNYTHIKAFDYSLYTNTNYKFTSVGTPLLFRISEGKNVKVFLESGVAIEYFRSVEQDGLYTWVSDTISNNNYAYSTRHITGKTGLANKFDFSIIGGAGIIIPMKKIGLTLSGHYHYGPGTVRKDLLTPLQNNYWKISLGIIFKRATKPVIF